jgi:hypothetical protein
MSTFVKPVCPECHSEHVTYMPTKSITTGGGREVERMAGLVRDCLCQECAHEWTYTAYVNADIGKGTF